jgi:hypothetical protein
VVFTDVLEELEISIVTLDMVHDLEDGGASVITSDIFNSLSFLEICSSHFTEHDEGKEDGSCSIP